MNRSDPQLSPVSPSRGSSSLAPIWAALSLLALCGLISALPLVGACIGLVQSLSTQPEAVPTTARAFSFTSLAWSLAYSSLIGFFAASLALPAAWCIGRRYSSWTALCMVPLLLPSGLIFSGWGVLRGPGFWLGDALARSQPWVSISFDRALAVAGMALWSWPIAALFIAASARSLPGSILDALALEPAGPFQRARMIFRLLAPGWLAGAAGVAVVSLGSAIPMHLAQLPTLSIELWKYMSLTAQPASAIWAAWPMVLVALLAAIWLVRTLRLASPPSADITTTHLHTTRHARVGTRASIALAAAVWLAAVLGPIVLYGLSLRQSASLLTFWHESSTALFTSLGNAGLVGALCAAIAAITWVHAALAAPRRPGLQHISSHLATLMLVVIVVLGLIPGVVIGATALAAVQHPWCPELIRDSALPLILAHTARFGLIGVIAGLWLAGLEPAEHRAARILYAPGPGGWLLTAAPQHAIVLLGVALAGTALSLHEIESSVVLSLPGTANLAQRLLDLLHYARDEQLAAAALNLLGLGTLLAGLTAATFTFATRQSTTHRTVR